MNTGYDIIVVGAGHAGCEAAAAAANLGSKVLLITMNMMNMAQMSCNPSMGGVAKGQIVREIDALGGWTGIITDLTTIQFRMLNKSKGPAMWSPRAQCDRMLFSSEWRNLLERTKKIDFWQDSVINLIVNDDKVAGVTTLLGMNFHAKAVILANGTFLNGIIHIGENHFKGGRIGERSSMNLTENLKKLGLETSRMKTGTPVRVDGRSLNFNAMEEQKGDDRPGKFSFKEGPLIKNQKSCFLTYTNEKVHEILRTGFNKSPLFTGRIKGRGPRYCPSIEDKIERFSERERHQLFIEPEGWNTVEYYVNGFSSSLPQEIQFRALKKVKGFEKAKFFRPGYAIEYDYFPPFQLQLTLQTRKIENLFLAGQINGTTGYEEAAAQGLMAGINAHLKILNKPPFILNRSEAYIGVLIDDLVIKGTDEPYRMFTSRAEYRILLRQDNADFRLTPRSYEIGLAKKDRKNKVTEKYRIVNRILDFVKNENVIPEIANPLLGKNGTNEIVQKVKICTLALRPQISLSDLIGQIENFSEFILRLGKNLEEEIEEAELLLKYQNYIEKEQEVADKLSKLEDMQLDPSFNYQEVDSLSLEAREKLCKIKPLTIGQAARISGVNPADIAVLAVYLGK